MPQKPLKANKKIDKKKDVANKHGKGSITRKGMCKLAVTETQAAVNSVLESRDLRH